MSLIQAYLINWQGSVDNLRSARNWETSTLNWKNEINDTKKSCGWPFFFSISFHLHRPVEQSSRHLIWILFFGASHPVRDILLSGRRRRDAQRVSPGYVFPAGCSRREQTTNKKLTRNLRILEKWFHIWTRSIRGGLYLLCAATLPTQTWNLKDYILS